MSPRKSTSNRCAPLLVLLSLVACTKAGPSVPAACEGVAAFSSEACLEAVSEQCRAYLGADDCWSAPEIPTDDYSFSCRWTHVAVVADVDSCDIGEVFGRCEASLRSPGFNDGAVGVDPCGDDGSFYGDGHVVFREEMELVDPASSPMNEAYAGIITAGSVVGGSSWENSTVCDPNVLPQAPSWCACAEQACTAKAGLE